MPSCECACASSRGHHSTSQSWGASLVWFPPLPLLWSVALSRLVSTCRPTGSSLTRRCSTARCIGKFLAAASVRQFQPTLLDPCSIRADGMHSTATSSLAVGARHGVLNTGSSTFTAEKMTRLSGIAFKTKPKRRKNENFKSWLFFEK